MSFFEKITRHKSVEQLQLDAGQSQDFRPTRRTVTKVADRPRNDIKPRL